VQELFSVIAKLKKITLTDATKAYIRKHLGERPLTGSDIEAILTRSQEIAVLAKRDGDVKLGGWRGLVNFIDRLIRTAGVRNGRRAGVFRPRYLPIVSAKRSRCADGGFRSSRRSWGEVNRHG
jgi:hypothetical protein